jgi:hypothetical protein
MRSAVFMLVFKCEVISSVTKGNGTVHPRTGQEGPEEEWRYSSYFFFISAIDRGGWSKQLPGHFILGKETWYPSCRKLGGAQGQSGWVWKILPPPGFDLQTMQSVASCHTNHALLAHSLWSVLMGKETGNLSFLSCGIFVNIVSLKC